MALIPEEVGAKESKIIRTTAGGRIEATHTYNVLDAYGTYAGWVHELAMEFGGTDEALAKVGPWTGGNADEAQVRGTDRPNLSKIVRAAESDSRTRRFFDAIESGDPEAVLAAYRADL